MIKPFKNKLRVNLDVVIKLLYYYLKKELNEENEHENWARIFYNYFRILHVHSKFHSVHTDCISFQVIVGRFANGM